MNRVDRHRGLLALLPACRQGPQRRFAIMDLALAPWVSAQSVVVEDWAGNQQNVIGVPTGWKKLTDELPFVKRKAAEALLGNSYDLEIVSDGPRRALRLRSAAITRSS